MESRAIQSTTSNKKESFSLESKFYTYIGPGTEEVVDVVGADNRKRWLKADMIEKNTLE